MTGNNPLLAGWFRKKGSKFGFWHKRYCTILGNKLILSKTESERDLERSIAITPGTHIEIADAEKPVRFIVAPEDGRPVCLAHDSLDEVLRWSGILRNLTMQTPDLDMSCFDIISTIGRGFYGKVMLVKKKGTEEVYAIKTIHKNRLIKANKVHTIFAERNILLSARHPFIVNICFAFQTDSKVYLGLEYAAGGELFHHFQKRGRIPLPEVRLYVAELALALNYLHFLGVIYRDLKPENVLLDGQGHLKLTDFGLSKQLDPSDETTVTFCGTSEYLAPEVIAGRRYTAKIDWWALGILCYELLHGKTPFANPNKAKLYQAIRSERPHFDKSIDPPTQSFILMLLEKDPDHRGDFDKIRAHPFFAKLDFEKVLAKQMKPAFVPPSNGFVASNFDREFTMENPQDSLATPIPTARDAFSGFSFAGAGQDNDTEGSAESDSSGFDGKRPSTM
jgi:serine/threonine protein kinase